MMTKSSLKMMRIQPKVDAIKKRYANLKPTDPKRSEMNTEMMALYKTEGVNMYGSCLPMLLQMPLFFAYYRVLPERRRAAPGSLVLAARSLAARSHAHPAHPHHHHNVLHAVHHSLARHGSRAAPHDGLHDARVFGFMLWHYASGLALYWGTSNILSLAMQIGINRSHWGKEMHAIADRRNAKKLPGGGSGPKTVQGKR